MSKTKEWLPTVLWNLLVEGLVDWIDDGWIFSEVMEESHEKNLDRLFENTLMVIDLLMRGGLVEAGDLEKFDEQSEENYKLRFVPWGGGFTADFERIKGKLMEEKGPIDPENLIWFNLTDKGKAFAQEVEKRSDWEEFLEKWVSSLRK